MGYTPESDGTLRVSYVGYGDTASEAINSCMDKMFGTKKLTSEQSLDDMDEIDDREYNGNLPPNTDQRDLDFIRNF